MRAIMNNPYRGIKQITLGKLLVFLSVASLLSSFGLIYILSGAVRDSAVQDLAREQAQQTSRLVFQSLYSAMRKGWNKDEIKEIIVRLNKALPGLEIDVYRGAIVEQQFGAMLGEEAIIAADPVLAQAFRGGEDMMLFPSKNSMRYLYPVQAKEECLVCHTQSHVGAVHGVIDITYPVNNIRGSINHVMGLFAGYFLLALSLVFTLLYFVLRRVVALPLRDLVQVMQRVIHGMDFSHRVGGRRWIVELQSLSDYFNHLLSTVHEYNQKLEKLAERDPLTNLYNRRKFEESLNYELSRAERHGHAFSLVMIDLDNFKSINDTYGHPVGDMVLRELTDLLAAGLRRGDLLARLGGDEFALILPETSPEMGLQVANKLHRSLQEREFELPVGKVSVTGSFSMVSYPADGHTREEIYAAMDVVLYKAKHHGKNRVMTAQAGEDRTLMQVFRNGDALRQALREGRIEAYLQPIVKMVSGTVVAYEALARMRVGETMIPAIEFIEVAEELGMDKELDRIVFDKALRHLCRIEQEQPDVKMFFNLSARSFSDIEWMRSIPGRVRQMGVRCENIVLEITEREAFPHLGQVKDVIDELRQSNISFALDDFGSGFSSFLYLKYLAVDYVKIEGSFVRQIALDERDFIMVQHIHQMAQAFGLKTVAEFVEDEATAAKLAEIGVDFAQGYHYGRPAAPIG